MNPGRGWKPDLEESYLPEYSKVEAATFTQSYAGIYLWLVKFSAFDPSPILRYSEISRMTKFNLLGFSGMKP